MLPALPQNYGLYAEVHSLKQQQQQQQQKPPRTEIEHNPFTQIISCRTHTLAWKEILSIVSVSSLTFWLSFMVINNADFDSIRRYRYEWVGLVKISADEWELKTL